MESPRCPECGARLTPARAEAGICPACMLQFGLEVEDESERELPERSESGVLPERIGPYRVLRLLGEGGMGVVYLAEQAEPVRRQVALKVVKRGTNTRDVLARFDAENGIRSVSEVHCRNFVHEELC